MGKICRAERKKKERRTVKCKGRRGEGEGKSNTGEEKKSEIAEKVKRS